MKTLPFLSGLLAASAVAARVAVAQTTVTVPEQTIMVPVRIPAQTITLPAGAPVPANATVVGAAAASPPEPAATTPPSTAPTPPSTAATTAAAPGTFWVYRNGSFKWAGDYSYGSGRVDYRARDPDAPKGPKVIAVIGDEGLQPYATNNDFNTTGYNYVIVSLKPTQPGNHWITGAEMVGDVHIPGAGGPPDIMKYGPDPAVVGQWNTYKIPLSAYGIKPGLHIYKIAFQQQAPLAGGSNTWYATDIGFSP